MSVFAQIQTQFPHCTLTSIVAMLQGGMELPMLGPWTVAIEMVWHMWMAK